MEKIIADTGFLVALTNKSDDRHIEVRDIYTKKSQILLPQTVLAEVAYLLGRDAGLPTVVKFLRGLSKSRFSLTSLIEPDITRIAEILDQYQDSRIDFVDASVMAMAERYKITTVLTIDRRDFQIFKPNHCSNFILLP
jgi:predicted nucleic acid-binding protein